MNGKYPGRDGTKRLSLSLTERRAIAHLAAEPYGLHDNAKTLISRASRVLQVSLRRATALWYGEPDHCIAAEETARLRAERDRLLALKLARLEQEIADLRRQLDAEEAGRLAARATGKAGASPVVGGCG